LAHDLIDIGSNLTHSSFAADLDQVIGRAVAAGVARQMVTGTDFASSRAAADLAARHPRMLWSTAGLHPHHAASFEPALSLQLEELLALPQVAAVGECGLDYYRDLAPRPKQRAAFIAQLEIAARTGKPVFLHQRDAHADFTAILSEHRAALRGGVAHCFTEGPAELEAYLSLDLSIGITGWVCDERRGGALRTAVPRIPRQKLMLETDAPYLLPRNLTPKPKSRRNEPAYLPHIAATVAALRGEPVASVAEATTQNAVRLFGLLKVGE
jgi:TatD DNase family protein